MVKYRLYSGGNQYIRWINEIHDMGEIEKVALRKYLTNSYRGTKGEIRKRLPAEKHYIVYPATTQGQKDLDSNTRQKSRVGRSSHCQIFKAQRPSLNSTKLHEKDNSERNIKTKT